MNCLIPSSICHTARMTTLIASLKMRKDILTFQTKSISANLALKKYSYKRLQRHYGPGHLWYDVLLRRRNGRKLFKSSQPVEQKSSSDIDICIGFNDDSTCPNRVTIGDIIHHFVSLGYKVGVNHPFSNSKTFLVPEEYHSVMIEVNKKRYMDEHTLEKKDGFDRLKADIQSLYTILLKQ